METELLRYPIGKPQIPAEPTYAEITSYRNTLAALPERLSALVADFDLALWNTPYRPEGWRCRQLVHHMADSHLMAIIRCKWTLTEDAPLLKGYNQPAFANLPDSATGDPALALDLLHALHRRWVALIDGLSEEAFRRTYIHPERAEKPETLAQMLALYSWHSRHHYMHIYRLLEREDRLPEGAQAWA